ncbi:MAG: hypothetical protein NT067_01750 [Candidatus Diapherotrites archaeon]|nr:hypothetical protein [Candidatus Diapherotrites archaeon]
MNMDREQAFLKVIELELVVSIIMLAIGTISGSRYFSGVAIGLIISWATGALAYWKTGNSSKSTKDVKRS